MIEAITSGAKTPDEGAAEGEQKVREALAALQRPRVRIVPPKPPKAGPPVQLGLGVHGFGKRKPPLLPRPH